ncbi:hypothetical protein Taro_001033 [Colocasia esculenta]|uniref:CCHC-type domain-containing protein n=1 Tax=Colocasia esculenta TaxID=4460 RepID=A0A843TDR1_COLES|nr:hypothetical protein [Colocasia esculenta]
MKGKHRGRMGMIQNDGEDTLSRQNEGHLWHYGAIRNLPVAEPNSRVYSCHALAFALQGSEQRDTKVCVCPSGVKEDLVGYPGCCSSSGWTGHRTPVERRSEPGYIWCCVIVTAIEEANDLKRMSLEKLIGSLMAHEINMERLGESSSRKKQSNALKAEEDSSEVISDENENIEDSENEEAMLSRRLQRILAKKKKFQSSRRHFKRHKDFKKSEGIDQKKTNPICYECKKPGHIKAECPKLKKVGHKKKDNFRRFKKYKKKAMAAAWENSSDSDSESSSSSDEEEANLAFMANTDDKPLTSSREEFLEGFHFCHHLIPPKTFPPKSMAAPAVSGSLGGYSAEFLMAEQQERFTFVKAKLCGNKAVDVADLEKNRMHSIVEALDRMKWTEVATLSEVSYPDLVKAFYVCLKSEEDGSLTSSVKVVEKIGQAIRSRNLRKSGFSVINGVWTKTTVAEGEAIIGKTQEVQHEVAAEIAQLAAAAKASSVAAAEAPGVGSAAAAQAPAVVDVSFRRIEDIPPEILIPVGSVSGDPLPSSQVASVLRNALDLIQSTPVILESPGCFVEEAVASGHTEEDVLIDAPNQRTEEEADPQGEHMKNANINVDDGVNPNLEGPSEKSGTKRKRMTHKRSQKQQLKINLKPIIKRLTKQNSTLSSIQLDIQSIVSHQTSAATEFEVLNSGVQSLRTEVDLFKQGFHWMKGEFDAIKILLSSRAESSFIPPVHSPVGPSGPSNLDARPPGPSDLDARPPGPSDLDVRPSGPSVKAARHSGQIESFIVQSLDLLQRAEVSEQCAEEERPSGPLLEEEPIMDVIAKGAVLSEDFGSAGQVEDVSSLVVSVADGEA